MWLGIACPVQTRRRFLPCLEVLAHACASNSCTLATARLIHDSRGRRPLPLTIQVRDQSNGRIADFNGDGRPTEVYLALPPGQDLLPDLAIFAHGTPFSSATVSKHRAANKRERRALSRHQMTNGGGVAALTGIQHLWELGHAWLEAPRAPALPVLFAASKATVDRQGWQQQSQPKPTVAALTHGFSPYPFGDSVTV